MYLQVMEWPHQSTMDCWILYQPSQEKPFRSTQYPLILGALLSAQAHSLDQLLWGRFFAGLGIGANAVLVPICISEVAPTKYRGTLGSLCQIDTCTGIIASLFLEFSQRMILIVSPSGYKEEKQTLLSNIFSKGRC